MGDWMLRAKTATFGLVALTALGGAQGCAEERDPINRVQAMAVPKSLFVRPDNLGRYLTDSDSWYFRALITDVPASQAVGFVGMTTEMYRIKWRIEENVLVAYREDPDILNSGDPHGGTVAAFPIDSHFDIRRQYNSTTGEESNVVEENTSDRQWEQREYFRVNWSNNLLDKRYFTGFGFDDLSAVSTYQQDPSSPDHPTFENGYVDISARYTVRPDTRTCFMLYRDYGCSTADVGARLSFMKVPERDFEPREYPDRLPLADNEGNPIRGASGNQVSLPMMDQYGFFRTERAVYDQRYGTLEKRFLYRANIWNIWEKWWARDAAGNVLKFENGDKVPLKYKERKVRPIVYFLNKDWPQELKSTAQLTADAWNDAFAETVASLRLLEDMDPGTALKHEDLRREVEAMKTRDVGYGPQFGERVYVLCPNNPVAAGDHPACGKEGTVARQGDLRYSFMHWVPKPQPAGPLGYGPSYADPITGQLFTANAYIYGAALDVSAQTATDIVNLLNGKFKEFDYANGIATDEYVKRLVAGEVPGPTGSAREGLEGVTPGRPDFQLAKTQLQVDQMVDRPLLQTIAKKGVPLAVGPSGQDRLNMIRGTGLERKLLDNPETHLLVAKTPDESLDDADIKRIGDVLLAGDVVKKENERLAFLGKNGCYMEASMIDDSVVGLAREMAKKHPGGRSAPEQELANKNIWQEMRQAILLGVLEHEVGHTVGLRHNFEGSSDALNFHDHYWNLKNESLTYGAPMTENQKNGKMTEFQYSTVMDYGARFNSDVHGLGKYDHAAIRFGYGNVVESFPKGRIKDKLYNAAPDQFGNGFFVGYSAEVLDSINRSYRHYTQIPSEFEGGIEAIKQPAREYRLFADVAENARTRYLKQGSNTSLVKTTSAHGGVDVVPYQYCGDEFAGSANRPLCQRWDQGMDSFEVVSDAIGRYQQYYIFDAFTRGKATGFNMLSGYLSKIATRYFSHVHSQYIHWLFYQGTYDYYWRQIFGGANGVKAGYISNADWFKDPAGGLPSTLATTWGLDRLIDVLGAPDVGVYIPNQDHALYPDNFFFEQATSSPYACTNAQGGTAKCESSANQLTLDIDNGARYRFTRYDNSTGQGFFNRIKNIGSFYDKIAALLMLTNSETNFVGQDQTNAVSYRIGFYLAYPKALSAIFGGVATDTYDNYAWRYDVPSTSAFGGAGDAGQVKLLTPNVFQSMGGADKVTTPAPGTLKGKPVDGGWYFFYKAYAMFFSMAEFQSNFSQSWNDASRVWCLGCGEAFTPSPNTTPVLMSDPLSGKQYGALVYGDGRYSPGAEFITQGQKLVKAYEDAQAAPPETKDREYYINRARARLQDHVELMDLIRGLYQVYGYTRF